MKLSEMWPQAAVKRSRVLAGAVGATAVVGAWSAGQPWMAVSLAGDPSCPAVTASATVDVVAASGAVVQMENVATCSTLWSEVAASSAVAASNFTSTFGVGGVSATVPVTAGLPSYVLWLAVSAAFVIAGLLLRNAILAAPGVLTLTWAYSAHGSSLRAMSTGLSPEQAVAQYGASVAWLAVVACIALALAAVVFTAVTNKKLRRERAQEEGRQTWSLDSMRDLSSAVLRMAADSRGARDAARE